MADVEQDGPAWIFQPPTKERGKVFVWFFAKGGAELDVGSLLETLSMDFGASNFGTPFGIYNIHYPFSMSGVYLRIVDEGPDIGAFLVINEADENLVSELTFALKTALEKP